MTSAKSDIEAALAAHQQTPHFLAFRQKTQGMHASPTQAARCANLFPPESA